MESKTGGKNINMVNRPRIVFSSCDDLESSFIQNDLELLRKYFDVRVVDSIFSIYKPKDALKTILNLMEGALWADVAFLWGADANAFWAVRLSKIFKKKSIVVVEGYEVAEVPELGYGAMLDKLSARKVKYVLKNANKVLAVSKFNKKEILKYTTSENVELVYNGIDCDKFNPKGEKEDLVITVGSTSKYRIKLKGLETFIKTAKLLPEIRFIVIGLSDDTINYLKTLATSNVKFTGFLSQDNLIQYYQKAKVYCQLSYRESFGMSLAEAMLCGCAPVVTNNAALPEVVGDTGFYVPYSDLKATAEAIKKALRSDKGKEARERIKNMFTLEKREKRLINEMERVLK